MFHIKLISCCLFPTYSRHCTFREFLFALASCRSWPRIQITGTICSPVALYLHRLSYLAKDIYRDKASFHAVYNLPWKICARVDMSDFNSH